MGVYQLYLIAHILAAICDAILTILNWMLIVPIASTAIVQPKIRSHFSGDADALLVFFWDDGKIMSKLHQTRLKLIHD
jgi:hypothetical protein